MTILYQSTITTTVNRTDDCQVLARCHLLSTGWEAVASISAGVDFRIDDASWDILRCPPGREKGGRTVTELKGVEAYLGAGPALRSATAADGELARQLLAECVKGIIQAETYLYKERGYADVVEYEASWKDNYHGSCRLYSDHDYQGRSWFEHVADRTASDVFFVRVKSAVLTAAADQLTVTGSFSDSFHDLGASLTIADGAITGASGNFLRSPDPICRETPAVLSGLIGRRPADLAGQPASRFIGGPPGCAHLSDLVDLLIKTVVAAEAESGGR